MASAHGIAGGTSDSATKRKIKPLFNPSERRSPTNVQFERHVTRLEPSQQQQLQRRLIFTTIMPGLLFNSSELTSPEDTLGLSPSITPVFVLHLNVSEEPHRRYQPNSSRLLAERSTSSDSISNSGFSGNISNKTRMHVRRTTRRGHTVKGASTVAKEDDEEEEADI